MRARHSVVNRLVTRHLRSDGPLPTERNILIVSHGILLQALIKAALAAGRRDGADPDLTQLSPMHANAAYTVLELRPVAGTLTGLAVSVVVYVRGSGRGCGVRAWAWGVGSGIGARAGLTRWRVAIACFVQSRENERSHLAALPKPPRALAVAAVAPGQKTLASAWGLPPPGPKRSKSDPSSTTHGSGSNM